MKQHRCLRLTTLQGIYLNYPRHPCLVGTSAEGKVNFMPASWNSPISFQPPIYGVAIAPERYTFELVRKARCFSISYASLEAAETVDFWGSVSGRNVDKVAQTGIHLLEPLVVPVPIPSLALVCFECSLIDMREYGDHWWVVGKVHAMHWDHALALHQKDTLLPNPQLHRPLLYMGRHHYITVDYKQEKHISKRWQHTSRQ